MMPATVPLAKGRSALVRIAQALGAAESTGMGTLPLLSIQIRYQDRKRTRESFSLGRFGRT